MENDLQKKRNGGKPMMKSTETGKYRYRPVLFFALTYLFTWIF